MPADGLALAVGVGRQDDGRGFGRGLLQLVDDLLALGDDVVEGLEVVVDVHPQLALGQVADMAHGGLDDVVRPQIFVDRLRLGRRLDDDQRLLHHHFLRYVLPGPCTARPLISSPSRAARSSGTLEPGPLRGFVHTGLAIRRQRFENGRLGCRQRRQQGRRLVRAAGEDHLPDRAGQLLGHVLPAFDEPGADPDQPVRAAAQRGGHRAGDGQYLAALLQGHRRRDQRPALARRLDDDEPERQPADDAVAQGEVEAQGLPRQRELCHHGPAPFDDAVEQPLVLGGVDLAQPRAQDGHRPSAPKRPGMGQGVDPPGHAADHDQPATGQVLGQALGHGSAVSRGVSRPDDGHSRPPQGLPMARTVEGRGRIVDFP